MAARTNTDWSLNATSFRFGGMDGAGRTESLVDAADDVEGGGVSGLQHVHHDGALAVHAGDIRLRRIAVANVRHVAHV